MAAVNVPEMKEASTPEDMVQDTVENAELVLFQAKECYVYIIPPRKSSASYRADEWNVNKWAWEGTIKVVSKGEDCVIRLEDNKTGELYAQAPLKADQPHPVEAVIDSSRFFVLRIEDTSSRQSRHAFIGIGFRERPEAYDFQAALFDHMNYLDKKKHAEEMEQEYQSKPSADYSLKEGESLRLELKTPMKDTGQGAKSKLFEHADAIGLNSIDVLKSDASVWQITSPDSKIPFLAPPPAPASVPSCSATLMQAPSMKMSKRNDEVEVSAEQVESNLDDDFGDFQEA